MKAKDANVEFEKGELKNEIRRLKTDNAALNDKINRKNDKIKELRDQIQASHLDMKGGSTQIGTLVTRLK